MNIIGKDVSHINLISSRNIKMVIVQRDSMPVHIHTNDKHASCSLKCGKGCVYFLNIRYIIYAKA